MLTPPFPDPVVDPWPGAARVALFAALALMGGAVVEMLGTLAWRLLT